MGLATIVTLAIVAVIVAALALYLIIIAATLTRVSYILGTVLIGVQAIADQCRNLDGYVRSIYGDVAAIEEALDGVVGSGRMRGMRGTRGRQRVRR